MKPGRRKSNDAVLKRRATVSELYLAVKTQYEISRVVGVTPQQVGQDLKRILEQWRSSTRQNFEQKEDIEIAKADQLEQEAWQAFEKSYRKQVTILTREGRAGPETSTKTEYAAGDPSVRSPSRRGIATRCKILGLCAPIKANVNTSHPITMELIAQRRLHVKTMKRMNETSTVGTNEEPSGHRVEDAGEA